MSEQKKLPFVWELKKDGVVSHAIGTHHLIPAVERYAADAVKYLHEKTYLLTETPDEKCPDDIAKRAKSITLAASLDQLTESEQLEFAKIFNTPAATLRETPILDFRDMLYQMSGYGNLQPLENLIFAAGNHLNVKNHGLETFQETLEVLERVAPDYFKFLRSVVEQEREQPGFIRKSTRHEIDSFIQRHNETDPPTHPDIFAERNRKMVERSTPYLSKPSVVAVGMMHFLCEPSLPTLYREHGIEVKRVQ